MPISANRIEIHLSRIDELDGISDEAFALEDLLISIVNDVCNIYNKQLMWTVPIEFANITYNPGSFTLILSSVDGELLFKCVEDYLIKKQIREYFEIFVPSTFTFSIYPKFSEYKKELYNLLTLHRLRKK